MDEGTLSRWLKQPGDAVAAGDAIAEIETDKAAVELESPVDGVLGRHLVAEGATALVGQALVRVLAPGESEDDAPAAAAAACAGGRGRRRCRAAAPLRPRRCRRPRRPQAGRPHRLTPRARRLAREHGIPYEAVGGGGRAGDVLALVASGGPPSARCTPGQRRPGAGRLPRADRAQGHGGLADHPALRGHARDRCRGAAGIRRLEQARGPARHGDRPAAGRAGARRRHARGSRTRPRPRRRDRPGRADPGHPRRHASSGSRASRPSARAPSSAPAAAGSRPPTSPPRRSRRSRTSVRSASTSSPA